MKCISNALKLVVIGTLLWAIPSFWADTQSEQPRQAVEEYDHFVYFPLVLNNYNYQNPPPPPAPGFAIDDIPFRFVGGFVPGWHWGQEWWSQATDDDLIQTARENGLTVLHLMLPWFEEPLGVYEEAELIKLDYFLDSASRHNVYVTLSFIHGLGIATQPDSPYYHPHGIEGLMTDPQLAEAFNNRIEHLVNRQNTFNQRVYRDDPTILGWIVCDEPISAPWNYPGGPPDVTVAELNAWLSTMASFIKSLDSNHLVTVFTTAAIDSLGEDWIQAFNVQELDFIYAEDADLRILNYFHDDDAVNYSLRFFTLNKPVVMMLSFTSGAWDQDSICDDYEWQAEMLGRATHRYFEVGETGVVVFSWGSDLYPFLPSFDQCYNYTPSNLPVVQRLRQEANWINPVRYPLPPLQFVKIRSDW